MVDHVSAEAGGTLVGLTNRIKTVESLRRKLADLVEQDPTMTVGDAAEQVYDVLRFTVVAEPDPYMAIHDEVLDRLRRQGVDVAADDHRWAGPGYRGINARLRASAGRRFEVQFHTRESFQAAKATRGLYEEYRLSSTPPARRAELVEEIDAIFARVPPPPGAVS